MTLRVFAPTPDPRGHWRCDFELRADELDQRFGWPHFTLGADGFQALLLAIGWVERALRSIETDGYHVEAWQLEELRKHRLRGSDVPAKRRRTPNAAARTARTRR